MKLSQCHFTVPAVFKKVTPIFFQNATGQQGLMLAAVFGLSGCSQYCTGVLEGASVEVENGVVKFYFASGNTSWLFGSHLVTRTRS